MRKIMAARVLVGSLVLTSAAHATVDVLQVVLGPSLTTGSVADPSPLAAFGYDPVSDAMYVTGFGGTGQDIRVVRNVSTTPEFDPLNDRLIASTAWGRFHLDGNFNLTGGGPVPGSILLNPLPILDGGGNVLIAAYGNAFLTDAGGIVRQGSGSTAINFPDRSQRLYRYNLQRDVNGDARDEMFSLVTTLTLQTLTGSTSTSTNTGRQYAFSSDGQSIYFVDSSSAYGGVYRTQLASGTTTRLAAESEINTEPAVLSVGGVDRIYVRGGGSTGNVGGIDYVDTADNTRKVAVAHATLADFLEIAPSPSDITIFSMTSDDQGNVYFNNTDSNPDRRGIYTLDPQGRMIKVVSYAERREVFGGSATAGNPNSNTLRMQVRQVSLPGTAADGASTTLKQVLYAEQSGVNAIAGAYVFTPGDFNRDNLVTQADYALFGSALTVRGVVAPVANLKYDLNGNGVVDWKDVKILQSFTLFPDGDTDFDGIVGFADLLTVAQNYNELDATRTWITGDFTGNDVTDFADLLILAQNYASSPGLVVPDASSQFVHDWAMALSVVPEPATLSILVGAMLLVVRRR